MNHADYSNIPTPPGWLREEDAEALSFLKISGNACLDVYYDKEDDRGVWEWSAFDAKSDLPEIVRNAHYGEEPTLEAALDAAEKRAPFFNQDAA